MRELVMAVGGPIEAGENRKSWLNKVARRAKISPRAAKSAFYEETDDAELAQKLREAAGRHEAQNLAYRFENLAVALNTKDADFHSPDVVALLHAARALRGLVGAGDDSGG